MFPLGAVRYLFARQQMEKMKKTTATKSNG
jgi:hypothetical protein